MTQCASSSTPTSISSPATQGSVVSSQRKRKQTFEPPTSQAPLNDRTVVGPSDGTHRLINDEDEDVTQTEPEVVDELYCTYKTNVVGVRYYTGVRLCSSQSLMLIKHTGLVGAGEQVGLVREPTNKYDRYASFHMASWRFKGSVIPEML